MQGYIKAYRKLMCSPIWQDPYYLKLWMYCLMKATHKERDQLVGNQMIQLKQGEFITGRTALSDDLNKGMKPKQRQSEITWWRYLNNLEEWDMLNIKKTTKYSVVSISKWSDYQESEQQMNNNRTTNEQQVNTNKNEKNVKNDKEKEYTSKIKDLLPVFSAIPKFNELNKRYWDVIRETRSTGKIAPSVIYNTMKKWEKYDSTVIQYSLKTHIDSHSGKDEKYTLGIMRGTNKEDASDRLNRKVVPMKKSNTELDWEAL